MSKNKNVYEYQDWNGKKIKHFSKEKSIRQEEDCDISQKIKSLEVEGFRLRSQIEEILHDSNDRPSSQATNASRDYESSSTICYYPESQVHHRDRPIRDEFYDPKIIQDGDLNHPRFSTNANDYHEQRDNFYTRQGNDSFVYHLDIERLNDEIEQLKGINFKLQIDLEKQADEFKIIEKNQNYVIERLKSNLSQLLSVNKKQEETLIESVDKLEYLNHADSSLRAIELLRDLLIKTQYYHCVDLFKENDIATTAPNMLVNMVEKCFKQYRSQLEAQSVDVNKLNEKVVQIKNNMAHESDVLVKDLQDRLASVYVHNTNQLKHIEELNERTHRELEHLREEKNFIENKAKMEIAQTHQVISSLERNLREETIRNKNSSEAWVAERISFENGIDELEKQIAIIRNERDQAINQKSSITAKLDATLCQLSETEVSVIQLQSDKYSLTNDLDSLNKRYKEMGTILNCSRIYFDNIATAVRICESAGDREFDNSEDEDQSHVWKPKTYQIEAIIHHIKSIGAKERDLDSKYTSLVEQYQSLIKQLETVETGKRQIEQAFNAQQLNIDSVNNDNNHLNNLIAKRKGEIERLTVERDYYFQGLNEKTDELASLKSERHRLSTSLEDRCRMLESHNNNISQMPVIIDTSVGKNQIILEDRNRLAVELQEIKSVYEKKLLNRDEENMTLKRTIQENRLLQTELKNVQCGYDEIIAENKKLSQKLRDSENEITDLCRDLQNHRGAKSRKHTNLEKKVSELNIELLGHKNELKIDREQIKFIEKGGSKSGLRTSQLSRLNSLVEPEPSIDNTKLTKNRHRSLEEQILVLETSKENLREENVKLTDLLKTITFQNERLADELDGYIIENKSLQDQVTQSNIDCSYFQDKNLKKSKTTFVDLSHGDHPHRRNPVPHFNNSNENCNDELLKQLRGDLQTSIKDARKLLSNTPWTESNKDNIIHRKRLTFEDSPYKMTESRQWSLGNHSYNDSNNNNVYIPEKLSSEASHTNVDKWNSGSTEHKPVVSERSVSPVRNNIPNIDNDMTADQIIHLGI